jgi:hypothetical protein
MPTPPPELIAPEQLSPEPMERPQRTITVEADVAREVAEARSTAAVEAVVPTELPARVAKEASTVLRESTRDAALPDG